MLTDDEIRRIELTVHGYTRQPLDVKKFARAIEAAACSERDQRIAELEALKKAIRDAQPEAWRCRVGEHPWWLEKEKPSPKLMMEIEALYTLKGIK